MRRNDNELKFIASAQRIGKTNFKPGAPKRKIQFGKQNAQFPGQELFPNATIEDIRALITNQKKIKGFIFDVPNGASEFPVEISGEARLMLGLSLVALSNVDDPGLQPESFSMIFNEEIIIRDVHPAFLSPFFTDEEYYQVPRPMSGQDSVNVNFENALASQQVAMVIYYL
jgi:hypothetical protein